jgi:hypothetical protein
MANKTIAFEIKVDNKNAVKGINNVTESVEELAQAQKLLDDLMKDTDLGATNFKEVATQINKTTIATDSLVEATIKETNALDKLDTQTNELGGKFKKLELQIRETRVALQKAEEAGDKLTFNKLKGDLDELEDKLEITKLKSRQLDDVLVALPGPLGLVGQAMKGLDVAMKTLIANPIVAILAAVVGVLALLKKSLSSTTEGQELLNRLSAAFGKILGPIMATIEKVAIPLFETFAFLLEKVGEGFSFVAKAVGISSSKIKEASINSSQALQDAADEQKKRNKQAKDDAEKDAKEEKDRIKKAEADRKAAYEKQQAQIAAIKKAKQDEINVNENLSQSEIELARSTIEGGNDVIANIKLKDAQREEDYQRERKRILDLIALEKAGSTELINLQIELNNLNAANNKERLDNSKELFEEDNKRREALLDADNEANEKATENFNQQLEQSRKLADTKIRLALESNQAEIDANEGNFERQLQLLNERESIIEAQYEARRQLVFNNQEAELQLEADYNSQKESLTDARIAIGQKEADAIFEQQQQIADIFNQASEIFGKDTQAGKFFASAAASINTGLAVSKALASSPPPLNFIQAGLVAAAGLKSIIDINKTQIPSASSSGAITKRASGGMIYGPGTSTSDSIPAYLSNGESVINARSTMLFKPLLSAINSVGGGRRFAQGGIAGESSLSAQSMINEQLMNISNQQMPPIKTYVVSTDMSSAQQFDRIQKERSTL